MAIDGMVSVIIPAYNAQATIAAAIEAVLAQDHPGVVELVIVDDGSTDQTAEIVRRYGRVKYVHQANAGPASARNRGAQEAQGEFLFFTDSDCRPEKSWISKMMQRFRAEDVSVVSGSYGIANPDERLARIIHAEIMFRHKALMPDEPRSFGSYNFAVRRKVFEAAGGFNAHYRHASGEDNDLSYKIIARGGRILFCRDALVDHYHQGSLPRYLQEQFRHGVWRVKMYVDHPGMAAGDGYTFWKDMAEVPLAAAHLFVFLWPLAAGALAFGFFFFEMAFGCMLMRTAQDRAVAGYVFWLRAFVRTAGFCQGGLLLSRSIFAGIKKT